eukprot:667649-Heterocapsa_arctica.AAC.1
MPRARVADSSRRCRAARPLTTRARGRLLGPEIVREDAGLQRSGQQRDFFDRLDLLDAPLDDLGDFRRCAEA